MFKPVVARPGYLIRALKLSVPQRRNGGFQRLDERLLHDLADLRETGRTQPGKVEGDPLPSLAQGHAVHP